MRNFIIILSLTKNYIWKFILLFCCIICAALTGLMMPYIIGKLIDKVFYSKNIKVFFIIISSYCLMYLTNQACHFGVNFIWARLETQFLFAIRMKIVSKVLRYKGITLSNLHSGNLISIMRNDVEQLMTFINDNILHGIASLVSLIASLFFVFKYNYILGFSAIILVPLSVYVSRCYAKKVNKIYKVVIEKSGLLSSWIFEIVKLMQEIKQISTTRSVILNYTGKIIGINRLQINANKVEVLSERVNAGISLLGQMTIFVISAILIVRNKLTIGAFTACLGYFSTCITVFNSINSKITSIANNLVSIDRVINVLNESNENYNEHINWENINGEIEFRNVSFSYNNIKMVLNNVSFEIKAHAKIAIVGSSGCGKSTIINLINKLYDTQYGEILIDNKNINDYNLISLRKQIGVVQQDLIMFNDTIRYNLIYSNDNKLDDLIWEILDKVNLKKFIEMLPNGLDTMLGTNSLTLSGGQKQKLAIAKVFLSNPKIIIFDEATSSLDEESENMIKDAWNDICLNRTLIIIAHRLSTIINSDKVLVIDNGEIAGYDNHLKLLNSCSLYKRLYKDQYFKENKGITHE